MIRELLTDLPPGKTLGDKFGMGVFDGADRLVGAIDVIRDYPEPREWYLGLLVLEPGQRNQGLGTKLLDALIHWLLRREPRICAWRCPSTTPRASASGSARASSP